MGIGAALATILVDEVAEVSAADRQIGPAQELAQRLNSVGGKAHGTFFSLVVIYLLNLALLSPALSMRTSMVVLKRMPELKSTAS